MLLYYINLINVAIPYFPRVSPFHHEAALLLPPQLFPFIPMKFKHLLFTFLGVII